mmetsp:Transcript_6703/g.10588  ORF Transcript_6703/g.10588 Transcript_6703/m.10588 type:complete len:239 (+) Transcript_6703:395-1111(+)
MGVEFLDTVFQENYQRNNKRGGLKNLRCFPSCGSFHRERGFCGRSVVIKVDIPDSSEELHAFAEFLPQDAQPRFEQGSSFDKETIIALTRSTENPLAPLMAADPVVDGQLKLRPNVFEFNRRRKGWHYGWTGNKHSCNTKHSMRLYIFSATPDSFICQEVSSSPYFVVYCRRRRRFTKEPSAPVMPIVESPTANKLKTSRSEKEDPAVPKKKAKKAEREDINMAQYLVNLANSTSMVR